MSEILESAGKPTSRFNLAVSKERGSSGLVYGRDGEVIGRTFPQNRRLRGGNTGRAWTAMAFTPDGQEVGCSLGTRHPDRLSAARAIRAFHRRYSVVNVALLIRPTDYPDARWHGRIEPAAARDIALKRAYGRAAGYFKYDSHEVCGLLKRYRGADPRQHERAAA